MMLLSAMLLTACQATPLLITSCPTFTWPPSKVIKVMKAEAAKDTAVALWWRDLARHGTECKALNE